MSRKRTLGERQLGSKADISHAAGVELACGDLASVLKMMAQSAELYSAMTDGLISWFGIRSRSTRLAIASYSAPVFPKSTRSSRRPKVRLADDTLLQVPAVEPHRRKVSPSGWISAQGRPAYPYDYRSLLSGLTLPRYSQLPSFEPPARSTLSSVEPITDILHRLLGFANGSPTRSLDVYDEDDDEH